MTPIVSEGLREALLQTEAAYRKHKLGQLGPTQRSVFFEDMLLALRAALARSTPAGLDAALGDVVNQANRAEAAAIALHDQRLVDRWRGVAEGAEALAVRLTQPAEETP